MPKKIDGTLRDLYDIAQHHLLEIAALFKERPLLTLIIRSPVLADDGIVITDDDYDTLIATLNRLKTEPRLIGPPVN